VGGGGKPSPSLSPATRPSDIGFGYPFIPKGKVFVGDGSPSLGTEGHEKYTGEGSSVEGENVGRAGSSVSGAIARGVDKEPETKRILELSRKKIILEACRRRGRFGGSEQGGSSCEIGPRFLPGKQKQNFPEVAGPHCCTGRVYAAFPEAFNI